MRHIILSIQVGIIIQAKHKIIIWWKRRSNWITNKFSGFSVLTPFKFLIKWSAKQSLWRKMLQTQYFFGHACITHLIIYGTINERLGNKRGGRGRVCQMRTLLLIYACKCMHLIHCKWTLSAVYNVDEQKSCILNFGTEC